jgi:hypothetical protein
MNPSTSAPKRFGTADGWYVLDSEYEALQAQNAELAALIQRELPFATAEGRKTWVADARAALAKARGAP